jgi:diguanylate cyclase (GGDEF)-like protein
MYETMTPVKLPPAAAGLGVAASRQQFPVELEAEFSELQAVAPCPSFLPAAVAAGLIFHALLIAEHQLLHLDTPLFALRALGVTVALVALMLLPAGERVRTGGRALALTSVARMVLALLGGISFENPVDLFGIQTGVAALIVLAGVSLRLPFAWGTLLAAVAFATDAAALVSIPGVAPVLRLESLWAPTLATAFSILSGWVRMQEARRSFLATRHAAFAEVQAGPSPDAHHLDEVTGIANRTAFDMRLRAAWENAVARRNSVALLAFSIDEFSQQKKQYGQRFGDMLQTQIASVLKDGLRRSDDMVARYDMHHFVVMLPGVGLDGATQIAERLRGCVEEVAVYVGTSRHRATVTVGVASLRAKRGCHRDQLVESSLQALEQAKAQGSNLVFVGGRGCLPRMA